MSISIYTDSGGVCFVVMDTPPIVLEKRLQQRYHTLIEQHLAPMQTVATGLRALPNGTDTFAATQAAWRFFKNPKVTLPTLCQPLVDYAQATLRRQETPDVLVVHDWCWLDFNAHTAKTDRMAHSHQKAQGYELASALAVCAHTGAPLAPLSLHLQTEQGVYSNRAVSRLPAAETHQDALLEQVAHVESLGLPARCVHVVDREADSVAVFRAFAKNRQTCLIRGKHNQRAQWSSRSMTLRQIAAQVPFTFCRSVLYHGRPALQYLAEAEIVLTRPYTKLRAGKAQTIPGPPVTLRLIISQVRRESGGVLADWFLYTNVEDTVPAATIALWYYWRWQIESFHKLLKSSGWHIEGWQQESGFALAKRLAVVAMAAVLVWAIAHSSDPQVQPLQRLLVRFSGRQMKASQPVTAPALLAGLWTLFSALELIEQYPPEQLKQLAQQARTLLGGPGNESV